MKVVTTLGLFGLGLTAVFGAAVAVGHSVGPIGPASPAAGHGATHSTDQPEAAAPGLSSSEGGYRLMAPSLSGSALSFTINGPDGRPLTAYTPTHTKDLHLIVVRRDLTGFRHVHPTRATDGTWSVPLALTEPGPYRVFADFAPAGQDTALILGADLTVPGGYAPRAPTAVSRTDTVDGYSVTVEGTLTAGSTSPLELDVSKGGRAVTDLQPYLGAFGHLVVLRRSDLAYLHVHPEEGGGLRFGVEVPSAGTYRLFLDFQHGGVVRTAGFTTDAG